MRRLAAVAIAVLLGGVAVTAVTMRLLPDDPARWHVDPLLAARTGAPNDYLVAPPDVAAAEPDRISDTYAMPPDELMERLDSIALAEPRTGRIAGGTGELSATYVQRSRLFGFPDYVSVRAVEAPGGSALAVWSRSRFGHSDLGVNRERVERWLAALDRDA